jgi:hypothetical protein
MAADCRRYEGIVGPSAYVKRDGGASADRRRGKLQYWHAPQLAENIHARWLAPMHYSTFAGDSLKRHECRHNLDLSHTSPGVIDNPAR